MAKLPALNRKLLLQSAIVLVALGVAAAVVLRGYDVRGAIDRALTFIREAGPLAFFTAMAVLPAFGFPLAPFTLSAGPAFAKQLGLPTVIIATCSAILVNILLSYVLARWLLRPWLEKLILRFGYKMPEFGPDNFWDVTILLRVTPGPPFFLQNFLLGLGRVPLRIYLIVSLLVTWSYGAAFVIFGDALLQGRGRMVVGALTALTLMGVGTQLVRKHYARRRAAAALVSPP